MSPTIPTCDSTSSNTIWTNLFHTMVEGFCLHSITPSSTIFVERCMSTV
uniref:Uncharacterized protein n=1 Tax=Caenorhabditis japonica TaxID=281687 RepID=A0A8R1IRR9_CAEJA